VDRHIPRMAGAPRWKGESGGLRIPFEEIVSPLMKSGGRSPRPPLTAARGAFRDGISIIRPPAEVK